MADTPRSDLAIHEESLHRLTDNNGFGLRRALEFAVALWGGTVDDIQFGAPGWRGGADAKWATQATISLTIGDRSRTFTALLPSLLDEGAARTADTYGIDDRVGGFRGTYWDGRFRQPVVTYAWKPGLHRITYPVETWNAYRGLVVGEFGTSWRLRVGTLDAARVARLAANPDALTTLGSLGVLGDPGDERDTEVLYERLRHERFLFISNRYTRAQEGDREWFHVPSVTAAGPPSEELIALRDAIMDPRRFVASSAVEPDALRDLAGWLDRIEASDTGTKANPGRLRRREPLDPDDPMAVPMHPRHWRAGGLGDALAAAIAHATADAMRRARSTPGLSSDEVVGWLRSALTEAVRAVARGPRADASAPLSEFATGLVSERPLNTLARLETSRQRTFIGFGGLGEYQGRLDLRVLPEGWKTHLCPLQTQESAKIGLIRHAALADWAGADPEGVVERYHDLSVAAALIPFIGHDDPTRSALGCKMLKQAVILDHPEPPLIRTGVEALVGEVGAARSPRSGTEVAVDVGTGIARIDGTDVPIGGPSIAPELPGERWIGGARGGSPVEAGALLAHAPDVVIEAGHPLLAYGVNATAAFLSWEGLNFEDGIVVSESFAERMRSTHLVRLSTAYDPWLGVEELLSAEDAAGAVAGGTPILKVRGDTDRTLLMPEAGTLVPASEGQSAGYAVRSGPAAYSHEIHVAYRVTRPLQVGDKLTTRHGGKGVVTRIEPDSRMPRLPDGRPVEVLLNPLGVITRLNIGTFMELGTGLEQVLTHGWDSAPPRIVPRRLGRSARLELAARLQDLAAPGGKLRLTSADGTPIGPVEGVMAGPLYLVKLDHLAKQKGGSRDDAAPSPLTFQPVKASLWKGDRRRAAPQRLGEMEVWSLEAMQATKTLDDLMAIRGVGEPELRADRSVLPAGLRAALSTLAVAGIDFVSTGSWNGHLAARDISIDPATGGPKELVRAHWRGDGEDLEDVIATFAARARDALAPGMRASRTGDGKAAPTPWAVARQILALAIGRPDADPARGPVASEMLRYEIRLPAPVDHPWHAKVPLRADDAYRVLPPLRSLVILPPSAFGGSSGLLDRDPVRRAYAEIIGWVLVHQAARDRLEEAQRQLPDARRAAAAAQRGKGAARAAALVEALAAVQDELDSGASVDEAVRSVVARLHLARPLAAALAARRRADEAVQAGMPSADAARAAIETAMDAWLTEQEFAVLRHEKATRESPAEMDSAVERIDRLVRTLLGSLRADGADPSTIAGRVTGKFGLLRRNGLGAAAIRSGRAVLVGDPTLGPEQVRIPRWMAHDFGIDDRPANGYSDVVLVNRQPTLHPYGLQALRARVWDEHAVALHPILLNAIAGDFDGDTVAVHRLESEAARREIWDVRRPAAALRSGASGHLLAKLDLDVQLGLALAGSDGARDATQAAEAAIAGLPSSDPGERATALAAIVDVMRTGFRAAQDWGPSVIALDPPDDDAALDAYLAKAEPELHLGFASGAAGALNSAALRQWLVGRGAAVAPVADLPDRHIDGNYLDGIADEHFFAAAQPAITGIAAKKLLTPFAGALTRRLVRHGYEIVIATESCYPDGRAHPISDCLHIEGPCAVAYEANPETGSTIRVGEPVGIRAALFIGEKGTQAALKSIHNRSGKGSGKAKLKELAAILLPVGADRGDGLGGGGGGFVVPEGFEKLRDGTAERLTHRNLMRRVMTVYAKELGGTKVPTHAVIRRMQAVLVARVGEILREIDPKRNVDPKHAAVLIRQRFLYDDPITSRPEGAPDGEIPDSALLPTSVWTGQLTKLVLDLGVPAAWDDDKHRLVAADPDAAAGHRLESDEHIVASERLALTVRNARPEAADG